jgi:hypothetical protein
MRIDKKDVSNEPQPSISQEFIFPMDWCEQADTHTDDSEKPIAIETVDHRRRMGIVTFHAAL